MKVTFLGTGSAISSDRSQSGILIKDEMILLDCGSGILNNIGKSKTNIREINNILITHTHLDHISDLPAIIKAKQLLGDSEISIYGPPGIREKIKKIFEIFDYIKVNINKEKKQKEKIDVKINEINPGESFEIKNRKIDTIETIHSIMSIGYRIDNSLVYSGDTEPFKEMASFAEGCGTLIHECSFPDGISVKNHTRPSDLAEVIKDCDIDSIYLTHLYPQTIGKEKQMKETIRKNFEGEVNIANDMKKIEIKEDL